MSVKDTRRKRAQPPVKINLNIDLENFGPIKKGKIKIKPLTIFVGPNNSGKSYAAMLIHSILSSENQINPFNRHYRFSNPLTKMTQLFNNEIEKIVKKNKGKDSFSIPTNMIKRMCTSLSQDIFSTNLESAISRNFASPINELVNVKYKSAKISVSNSSKYNILINKKLNVKTDLDFNFKYKIKISPKRIGCYIKEEEDKGIITINISKEYAKDFLKDELSDVLIRSISRRLKHDTIPAESHYIPATRSGILQGYNAISASIIKSASFGGIESFEVPKLTGMVSDFISNIILVPTQPGPFFKLAEQFESELLCGHIKLSTRTRGAFPEIIYQSSNNEIPLHRTSSIISEIAPLSLYLKHIIHPSSLLIIEEPEAHLHPTNQLIFAKYIVKMIRAGLNVLVTTHSVFLLEQLGAFMLASKLESKTRQKLEFIKDDYLLPEEVSPYVFSQNSENEHNILPIEIDDEVGISQEEFVKVNELLYSESIELQQNLLQNLA